MPTSNIKFASDKVNTAERWAEADEWVFVISSNVAAIKYDDWSRILYVKFDSGDRYYYPQVSKSLAMDMYNCGSHGKFIWYLRKSGYRGVKM